MACARCQWQARRLAGVAAAAAPSLERNAAARAWPPPPSRQHRRPFGASAGQRGLFGLAGSLAGSYHVLGATERLFKACSRPADYRISDEARKRDEVERLDDGEELGRPVVALNVWHKSASPPPSLASHAYRVPVAAADARASAHAALGLPPSFSTWSHVTMLHLYLLNARVRCFERGAHRDWQQQLVDHFFFECEKKMHVDHNLTSSALRQRYLKDVLVQWRGLLLGYDEGLVRGDAVLASAVWRNLFKGAPAVDPRALLAVVGWLRASLAALEDVPDDAFASRAEEILAKPVDVFWTRLEGTLATAAAAAAAEAPGRDVGENSAGAHHGSSRER